MDPKITFEDKEDFIDDISIPEKNKITANNINEMKRAINEGSSSISVGDTLETAEKKALFIQTITPAQAIAETRGITVNEYDIRIPMNQVRVSDEINSQGLDEYLNKKVLKINDGYELTQYGIVMLENINIDDCKTTLHSGYVMSCTGTPIVSNGYLKVDAMNDKYCIQTFREVVGNTIWQRQFLNGTWYGWKLIAGEVLLWNGSAYEMNTMLDLQYSYKMFGTLYVHTSGKWGMSGAVTDNFIVCATAYNAGDSVTLVNSQVIFAVGGDTRLSINAAAGYYKTTANNLLFVPQTITKIVGRP